MEQIKIRIITRKEAEDILLSADNRIKELQGKTLTEFGMVCLENSRRTKERYESLLATDKDEFAFIGDKLVEFTITEK